MATERMLLNFGACYSKLSMLYVDCECETQSLEFCCRNNVSCYIKQLQQIRNLTAICRTFVPLFLFDWTKIYYFLDEKQNSVVTLSKTGLVTSCLCFRNR